jgi:threonine dehydrogenase-like Zn-dependent dehydrogenase
MTRLLYTEGNGTFLEKNYVVQNMAPNQIRVRSIMTGVCRSDIDMMLGHFPLLPEDMSGHEGLGQVVAVGNNVLDIQVGDYVATRGEPAYADEYNVDHFVQVPEADPKYIVEPVGCALNIGGKIGLGSTLIIGTGFLATVIAQWLTQQQGFNIMGTFETRELPDIVGNSNIEPLDTWGYEPYENLEDLEDTYDNVVILKPVDWQTVIGLTNDNGKIIVGSPIIPSTIDFSEALWKNITMHCPSPRDEHFNRCMQEAVDMIELEELEVDTFWTKGYNRDTEWQQAFADAADRPNGYSRGYIEWR